MISTNCPTTPVMTFGDSLSISCVAQCPNGTWGDSASRNCVGQCPNIALGATYNSYGDSSTGKNLCVYICPSLPVLFGVNSTSMCTGTCPSPLFGDVTVNRTCVTQCPITSGVTYYAQLVGRICVQVCMNGTWG